MKTLALQRKITVGQLAAAWGWSIGRIYRLVEINEIPHVRLGQGRGRIYFEPDALEEWLATRRQEPVEKPMPLAAHGLSRAEECRRLGIPEVHEFS